ncbi:histone H5 [Cephus cinctus]|uniref:Histone H5 n=1 Tax=Cephus cinctus TaxID=211228 RepID=A0AAJ7C0Y0_CEPCN|nr:histone H5 [Cephus cinctus]
MTPRKSPRIEALVVNAIKRLQDMQGSTSKEISNYISQEYNVPAPKVRKHVNIALRRGLSFGVLHRSKGGYYRCGDQDIRNGPMDAVEDIVLKRGRRGCKRHSRRRRRKRRSRHGRCKSRRRRRRKSCRRPRRRSCRRPRRHRRRCKSKSRRRRRRRKMGRCCDGDAGDRVTFSGRRGPRNDSFRGDINGSERSSGSDLSGGRRADEVAPGQDFSPSSGNCLD